MKKPTKKQRSAFYLRAAKEESNADGSLYGNNPVLNTCWHNGIELDEIELFNASILKMHWTEVKRIRILALLLCYQMCK